MAEMWCRMVNLPQPKSELSSLWYCRIDGLDRGPITWEMLQGLAQGGDLKPSDLVRRADLDQWVVASQARCAGPVATPSATPLRDAEVTVRLAAALAADTAIVHAPARSFKRPEIAPPPQSAAPAIADDDAIDGPASVDVPVAVMDAEIDEPAEADVSDLSEEVSPEPAGTQSAQGPAAMAAAGPDPVPLPAAAIARAVRSTRTPNSGGLALLALGLALIGLFKLALPLGLLSLYLGWRSAADLRRRPLGPGLAVAAGALIVAAVDVSVSLYTIVNRL